MSKSVIEQLVNGMDVHMETSDFLAFSGFLF